MSGLRNLIYLVGDEDGGVGVNCRACDRGGKPLAYVEGCCGNPYDPADVPSLSTLDGILFLADTHMFREHVT